MMIGQKGRHNWFLKTMAMGAVCLFLFNSIVWAHPDTLAPPVGLGYEETRRELHDELQHRKTLADESQQTDDEGPPVHPGSPAMLLRVARKEYLPIAELARQAGVANSTARDDLLTLHRVQSDDGKPLLLERSGTGDDTEYRLAQNLPPDRLRLCQQHLDDLFAKTPENKGNVKYYRKGEGRDELVSELRGRVTGIALTSRHGQSLTIDKSALDEIRKMTNISTALGGIEVNCFGDLAETSKPLLKEVSMFEGDEVLVVDGGLTGDTYEQIVDCTSLADRPWRNLQMVSISKACMFKGGGFNSFHFAMHVHPTFSVPSWNDIEGWFETSYMDVYRAVLIPNETEWVLVIIHIPGVSEGFDRRQEIHGILRSILYTELQKKLRNASTREEIEDIKIQIKSCKHLAHNVRLLDTHWTDSFKEIAMLDANGELPRIPRDTTLQRKIIKAEPITLFESPNIRFKSWDAAMEVTPSKGVANASNSFTYQFFYAIDLFASAPPNAELYGQVISLQETDTTPAEALVRSIPTGGAMARPSQAMTEEPTQLPPLAELEEGATTFTIGPGLLDAIANAIAINSRMALFSCFDYFPHCDNPQVMRAMQDSILALSDAINKNIKEGASGYEKRRLVSEMLRSEGNRYGLRFLVTSKNNQALGRVQSARYAPQHRKNIPTIVINGSFLNALSEAKQLLLKEGINIDDLEEVINHLFVERWLVHEVSHLNRPESQLEEEVRILEEELGIALDIIIDRDTGLPTALGEKINRFFEVLGRVAPELKAQITAKCRYAAILSRDPEELRRFAQTTYANDQPNAALAMVDSVTTQTEKTSSNNLAVIGMPEATQLDHEKVEEGRRLWEAVKRGDNEIENLTTEMYESPAQEFNDAHLLYLDGVAIIIPVSVSSMVPSTSAERRRRPARIEELHDGLYLRRSHPFWHSKDSRSHPLERLYKAEGRSAECIREYLLSREDRVIAQLRRSPIVTHYMAPKGITMNWRKYYEKMETIAPQRVYFNQDVHPYMVDRIIGMMAYEVDTNQRRNFNILHVGSGDGRLIRLLEEAIQARLPDITFHLYGVDTITDKIKAGTTESNVTLVNGSAEDLGCLGEAGRDGFFDIIIDDGLTTHGVMADAQPTVAEWARTLREGGLAISVPWMTSVLPTRSMDRFGLETLSQCVPENLLDNKLPFEVMVFRRNSHITQQPAKAVASVVITPDEEKIIDAVYAFYKVHGLRVREELTGVDGPTLRRDAEQLWLTCKRLGIPEGARFRDLGHRDGLLLVMMAGLGLESSGDELDPIACGYANGLLKEEIPKDPVLKTLVDPATIHVRHGDFFESDWSQDDFIHYYFSYGVLPEYRFSSREALVAFQQEAKQKYKRKLLGPTGLKEGAHFILNGAPRSHWLTEADGFDITTDGQFTTYSLKQGNLDFDNLRHNDAAGLITRDAFFASELTEALPEDLAKGEVYTIRIDTDRMTATQVAIAREWHTRMQRTYPNCEFRFKPFSSGRKTSKEPAISIHAETRDGHPIGHGQIDVERKSQTGEVFQRTMGMRNICFAAANIPESDPNSVAQGRGLQLVSLIRRQYMAITGEELPIKEDTPEAINEAIRNITIIQEPATRIDFNEQDELRLSIEALDSAA